MKRCGGCGETKALDQFVKSARNRDGRGSRCKPCNVAGVARWREANPGCRRREYLRQYGLTEATYQALVDEQGGHCALCDGPTDHIDHDHETGRVRGLLCFGCNTALGKLGDTAEALERVVEYLREP